MRCSFSSSLPVLLAVATTACFNPDPAPVDGTDTDGQTTGSTADTLDGTAGGDCQDGILNGEETDVDCGGPTCEACAPAPSCTDGILNGEETDVDCGGGVCSTCDDGQGCGSGLDCTNGVCTDGSCQSPSCGDGVVNAEDEQCDDAGDSAACNADCTAVACGDGLVNMAAGEDCDEIAETAACDEDCTLAECGDGLLNVSAGELCDDGAASAACDDDCTPAECGDGLANRAAGEACDDGEQTATCDADCTAPMCGDALVNALAGEQCDDGDAIDDNLCSNACSFNACVFDTGLLPVTIHPNNFFGDLDFDGSCNLVVSGGFEGSLHRVSAMTGAVSTLVASFAGSSSVNGVAHRDSDDLTYVATDGSPILWSVAADGTVLQVMPLPVTINAIVVAPPGFGAYADRIIGVGTNGSVYAFDPATASSAIVGTTMGILSDLAFDPTTTTLYIAANGSGQVLTMSGAGATAMVAGGFSGIDGLAVDPAGTLYVADSNASSLTAIDLNTGAQMVVANPVLDGGYYVTGLVVDGAGTVLMKVGNMANGADVGFYAP